ncbi:hypothetical protein [Anoxybacteroides rupiense]|uniref:hypothetical protein n=1 Tax=Anoxybacteroides rupiense TaxID=311460 RepID=UPI001F09C789|nr:hypothetical protein [Anoxybacillus rupiensis]
MQSILNMRKRNKIILVLFFTSILIGGLWGFIHIKKISELNKQIDEKLNDKFSSIDDFEYTETNVSSKSMRVVFAGSFDFLEPSKQYALLDSMREHYVTLLKKEGYVFSKKQIVVMADIATLDLGEKNVATLRKDTLTTDIVGESKVFSVKDLEGASLNDALSGLEDVDQKIEEIQQEHKSSNGNNSVKVFSLSEDDKINAWVIAQKAVKDRLKAPSTADFPMYDERFVSAENGNIVVQSYVDAQNGFGAMIRSNFVVTLDGNLNVIDVYIE